MRMPRIRLAFLMLVVALVAVVLAWDQWYNNTIHQPEFVQVRVSSALPGRPIDSVCLVRPDGTITLGSYGDVHVEGLSPQQAEERIAAHLRRYLSHADLRHAQPTPLPGARASLRAISPSQARRVSVRIETKNSSPAGLTGLFQKFRRRLGWP